MSAFDPATLPPRVQPKIAGLLPAPANARPCEGFDIGHWMADPNTEWVCAACVRVGDHDCHGVSYRTHEATWGEEPIGNEWRALGDYGANNARLTARRAG